MVDVTWMQCIDTLWLFSSYFVPNPPMWQGFMSTTADDTPECPAVVFNPMIPLNPNTDDCVYSTMSYIREQATKAGKCCAVMTFDQPLYARAVNLQLDYWDKFHKIFLRIGGFHQLVSFLGASCKRMEGSGLEKLLESVYAKNSIPKMMEGKAYTRTLRALLLLDCALHHIMSKTFIENEETVHSLDDTYKPSISKAQWEHLLMQLKTVYESILSKDISLGDASKTEHIQELFAVISEIYVVYQQRRTAKLWLNLCKCISIIRRFIQAERTHNWDLHLLTCDQMLPILAAAGHNNYTKCIRYYLQYCKDLCECVKQPFKQGKFTISRGEDRLWSGTFTDQVIEQTLMRSGKSQGGLINITHRDTAQVKWLTTAHIMAEYSDVLRNLTSVTTDTMSEPHRDMGTTRRATDAKHVATFEEFLTIHNPFTVGEPHQLVNISSGIVADGRVNAENRFEIGSDINNALTGEKFNEIKFKRKQQAVTFSIMMKPLKLIDGNIHMSSVEIQQRLLSLAKASGHISQEIFEYELSVVSPPLFYDDGNMRKNTKSCLVDHMLKIIPTLQHDSITSLMEVNHCAQVIDGSRQLRIIEWPKIGTVQSLLNILTDRMLEMKVPNWPFVVLLDTYREPTTKSSEHKRRNGVDPGPDTIVNFNTPVPKENMPFLANNCNKQCLIDLWESDLHSKGVSVELAEIDGDADILIVRTALQIAGTGLNVKVRANDTDILVMLVHHFNPSEHADIFYMPGSIVISVRLMCSALGQSMCDCLPFIHAASGCDTTSAFYNIGKVKPFQLIKKSEEYQKLAMLFGDTNSDQNDRNQFGIAFVLKLYDKRCYTSLEKLRYAQFTSSVYIAPERRAPTTNATQYHFQRVHHQVATFRHLTTMLPPEDFGFRKTPDGYEPIITDKDPAPAYLLKNIRCACKVNKILCGQCTCRKYGVFCTYHCKCAGDCTNTKIEDDDND